MFLRPEKPIRRIVYSSFALSKADMGGEYCNVATFRFKLELMIFGCQI